MTGFVLEVGFNWKSNVWSAPVAGFVLLLTATEPPGAGTCQLAAAPGDPAPDQLSDTMSANSLRPTFSDTVTCMPPVTSRMFTVPNGPPFVQVEVLTGLPRTAVQSNV